MNLTAKEIATFIPSVIDFQTAMAFYVEIGFSIDYQQESLAIMRKDT